MKILLFGSNGQLGSAFRRYCSMASDLKLFALDRTQCDAAVAPEKLRQTLWPLIENIAPDVVISAAAYTAVDRAESEPDIAFRVNASFPHELASASQNVGAQFVHFSSDYVFDGCLQGRGYVEDDPCNPLSVYGRSKREGEIGVLSASHRAFVIRTSWVVGIDGQNFAKTILRLACERNSLRVVADQWGVPSPASFIVNSVFEALKSVADKPIHGVYHLCPSGLTNWHGYASLVFERAMLQKTWFDRFKLKSVHDIKAISTVDYPTPATRPLNSRLDCGLWQSSFSNGSFPDWADALTPTIDAILLAN